MSTRLVFGDLPTHARLGAVDVGLEALTVDEGVGRSSRREARAVFPIATPWLRMPGHPDVHWQASQSGERPFEIGPDSRIVLRLPEVHAVRETQAARVHDVERARAVAH